MTLTLTSFIVRSCVFFPKGNPTHREREISVCIFLDAQHIMETRFLGISSSIAEDPKAPSCVTST
jgi:hypothetical protein